MDWQLFSAINQLAGHSVLLDKIMIGLAQFGPLLMALPMLIVWFTAPPEERLAWRQMVLRSVLAAILALMVNQVIGMIYFRPRPSATHSVRLLLPGSREASFPSDHAAGSWALAWGIRGSSPVIFIPTAILAALISIARIYVGLHYPLDVAGGILVGIAATYVIEKLWPLLMSSRAEALVRLATRFPQGPRPATSEQLR